MGSLPRRRPRPRQRQPHRQLGLRHEIDSGFNRVQRNRVTRGAFGIGLGGLNNEFNADVREHVVRDVEEIGIGFFSPPLCSDSFCKSLVRDNSALGSGAFDCFDPEGVGRWMGNTGVTDFPEGLCRAPAGSLAARRRAAGQAELPEDRLEQLRKRFELAHSHGLKPAKAQSGQ